MNDNLHIRAAKTSDAEALLAIYKPYIENTAINLNTIFRALKNLQIA